MRWSTEQLGALTTALDQCVAGRPTTVVITGVAGMGKSALLDEFVRRAAGFSVVTSEGFASSAPTPYDALDQLGIGVDAGSPTMSRTLAAQQVRAWLNDLLPAGPVLIVVDDLQWTDEESIAALLSVMGRAVAEPLLLCLATRPLDADQHADFQRWSSRSGRVRRVDLTGLDVPAALDLLAEVRPELLPGTATALCHHVGGNPLYLRSLAEEYDADELSRMQVLPAPAGFAATIRARVRRLSASATALVNATAVLSDSWCSLRDAAAVAEVGDPAHAADELLTAQLILIRDTDVGEQLRVQHSLVRSAMYQSIPLDSRRSLHARAARTVSGTTAAFDHRLAAAVGYDDVLAADLATRADALRGHRSFGAAARYERLASTVTTDPKRREQRRLDSLFDSLMAMDRAAVRRDMTLLDDATDPRRRDLVLGVLAVWERRPHDGVRLLQPWSGAGAEDVVQCRIETMSAWALLMTDAAEHDIRAALAHAAELPLVDEVTGRFAMLVRSQLAARHIDAAADVPLLRELPDDPRHVPPSATSVLAWRGTFSAGVGHFARAIDDLVEVTDRMQHGQIEFSSGSYHAILGRTQWFAGDWARARVNLRTAAELSADYPHPIVVSAVALPAIGAGVWHDVDEQLAQARDLLRRVPWREAVDQLLVTEIIRAHARQSVSSDLFALIEPGLADLSAARGSKSALWKAHAALAAVWAGQYTVARDLADQLERSIGQPPWAHGLAEWVRGLAAEAQGDGKVALRHLTAATRAELASTPLYRAHVHTDHARVAHLTQGEAPARHSLEIASGIYRALEARAYLDRVRTLQDATSGARASTPTPQIQLSERERDVLTLVVAGMSYAQVARDLFITQSTVSYHLGNIYAKTDVKSRHQLTQLARSDPASLGLADLATAGAQPG